MMEHANENPTEFVLDYTYHRNAVDKTANGMFAEINGKIEILLNHKFQNARLGVSASLLHQYQFQTEASAMVKSNQKKSSNNTKMNVSATRANERDNEIQRVGGMGMHQDSSRSNDARITNWFQPQPQFHQQAPDESNAMAGFIRTPYGWYRDMNFQQNPSGSGTDAVRVGVGAHPFHGSRQQMSLYLHNHGDNRSANLLSHVNVPQPPLRPMVGASPHTNGLRDTESPITSQAQAPRMNSNGSLTTTMVPNLTVKGSHYSTNGKRSSNHPRKMFFNCQEKPKISKAGSSRTFASGPMRNMTDNGPVPSISHRQIAPAHPVPRYVSGYTNSQQSPHALADITNQNDSVQIKGDKGDGLPKPVGYADTHVTYGSNGNYQGQVDASIHSNNTPKRSVDDLHSLCSSSSWSSSAVPNMDVSEQKNKRQRSTAQNDSACPRGMLDLLCEATAIVSKRMEAAAKKPASFLQAEQHQAKKQVRDLNQKKKVNLLKEKIATIPRTKPGIVVSRSPTPIVKAVRNKPRACNCPRSRCIKLYCECFQSGKFCTDKCTCKKCKNTEEYDGPGGDRTRAIQNILSRNPYAFQKDKQMFEKMDADTIGVNCRCVKSQCLKLYCDCFQSGKFCGEYCMCVNCLNTVEESGEDGKRTIARSICLLRKPDAFKKKVKVVGGGCSCKNSRCLKKYCACFDSGLACTSKCCCKDCQNLAPKELKAKNEFSCHQSPSRKKPSKLEQ